MGISSLGVGSGILTQDVLDQLRDADEAGQIRPIDLELANENDKQDALKIIDASMTNFADSTTAIKNATLWDEREATVNSGSSVEVTAVSKTDVQDFTLNVVSLATKQIEESGAFGSATDIVDTSAGTFDIQVGASGTPISISYDANATLDDIKDLINKEASNLVDATIVQISSGEFRLFLSSDATGADTDISLSGAGLDSKLTTGLTQIQPGTDAEFEFNGQTIHRASNKVDDVITGLTITLKNTGLSDVSIKQNRSGILEKFDSFVEKYNSNMHELDTLTKVSVDSDRGIFSSDSTIKSMKRSIRDLMDSVGGGVGSMVDYGITIDKDGKMSLDKTVLEAAMDSNPRNVQAFFSGGDYTDSSGTVTTVNGIFTDISTTLDGYTSRNKTLDQLKDSLTQNISALEDRKTTATERLDAKYAILKKQFTAYDAMISKFNSASSIFTQMVNAENAAAK